MQMVLRISENQSRPFTDHLLCLRYRGPATHRPSRRIHLERSLVAHFRAILGPARNRPSTPGSAPTAYQTTLRADSRTTSGIRNSRSLDNKSCPRKFVSFAFVGPRFWGFPPWSKERDVLTHFIVQYSP